MFDPRSATLLGTDSHLPAVDVARLSAPALRARFAASKPWQPELTRDARMLVDRAPRHAAVLVPIVLREQPMVLLTQRTAHLKHHSGQIAFPGGKVDKEDENAVATALREAEEEVGLATTGIDILGTLPDYLTASAYWMTPVVALLPPVEHLTPNPHEVAAVFEVPLAFLMNPAHHRRYAWVRDGQCAEWLAMPYADQGVERFIWGATAAVLRNLYRYLIV